MSVRKKTLIIILSTLACLTIAIFAVSNIIIERSYNNLEAQEVRQNVRRAQNAILNEVASLDSLCRDISRQNATYAFMQLVYKPDINSLLPDQFFSDYNVNFALLLNQSGDLVYGKGYDTGSGREVPLQPSLTESSISGILPLPASGNTSGGSGVVSFAESPAVIAFYPILSSDGQSPGLGTFIVGHYLDSTWISQIAKSTYLYHLNIYQSNRAGTPFDLNGAIKLLNTGLPIAVVPANHDYVAGYSFLNNVFGGPSLILKIDQPRTIYLQGVSTARYFAYSVIIVGVIFTLMIMLLLERQILSRLTLLRRQVSKIDLSQGKNIYTALSGKDEFAELSATIDHMLGKLEVSFNFLQQSETRLRESEEKFSKAFHASPDCMAITTLEDGAYLEINDSFTRLTGYSRENIIGKHMVNMRRWDEDGSRNIIMEELKTNGRVVRKECKFRTKSGKIKTMLYSAETLKIGGVDCVLSVTTDITERKQHEEQLLVTSKLASIGELASGVAHELNNPLTSIIGYAQLLSNNRTVAADVKADLDKIYRESQRAARIVQNLLSFARQHKPQKSLFNVNDLVKKSLELRAYEQKTSNILVTLNLRENLSPVMADYYQMQQVLLNIIINAEQAIAELGRSGEIAISTEENNSVNHIIIRDNGCGIKRENLDRIFDPFFTTKDVNKGTGLGLSICHGIISEHGGRIYAESLPGKGSSFHIELPIAVDSEIKALVESTPVSIQPSSKRKQGKVLIIDDEPGVREVMRRILQSAGFSASTVSDGKTGLAEIKKDGYDLCLVDMKMPDMSGREIFENIKRDYPGYVNKIIFVTGDTITSSTQQYLVATGRPYLGKPFSYKELIEKIEKCLAGTKS